MESPKDIISIFSISDVCELDLILKTVNCSSLNNVKDIISKHRKELKIFELSGKLYVPKETMGLLLHIINEPITKPR